MTQEDLNNKSYGVKVSILSILDYQDYKEILEAISKLGYKIMIVDNGNAVCEKKQ